MKGEFCKEKERLGKGRLGNDLSLGVRKGQGSITESIHRYCEKEMFCIV